MTRRMRAAGAGTALATAVTMAATLAMTAQGASAKTVEVPGGLEPVQSVTSLTGVHHWYRQVFKGLPVLDSYYAQHVSDAGTSVDDGRVSVPASLATAPAVSSSKAGATATTALAAKASTLRTPGPKSGTGLATAVRSSTLAVEGGADPALVWSVVATSPEGVTRTTVDASTGAVRGVTVLSKNVKGKATVFRPNPLVTLKKPAIMDKNDTAQPAVFGPAYRTVPLPGLVGDGSLTGPFAKIVDANVALANEPTHVFDYTRDDDRFEQVNAYAAVDGVQRYIRTLGFTDANAEQQDLETNTFTGDNSFYDPSADRITLGSGGVDDAEDMEVVWHEYGHALQDAIVPGFGGSLQAGSMGEGFGDYLALTMSAPYSAGFDLPCIMDWDATSYTSSAPHCLRRTDTGKTTDDIEGEVHADGEIWSAALYRIYQRLGRTKADKIILEGTYGYSPNTSFAAAAQDTVDAATSLYGAADARKVRAAFVAGKIL